MYQTPISENDVVELFSRLSAIEHAADTFHLALLARLDRFDARIQRIEVDAIGFGGALADIASCLSRVDQGLRGLLECLSDVDRGLADLDTDLSKRLARTYRRPWLVRH